MQTDSIRDDRTDAILSLPSPAHSVTLDCMFGAAGYVSREFGDYGYRLGIVASGWTGGAIFELSASDGSRRRLDVDRYGNVTLLPEAR